MSCRNLSNCFLHNLKCFCVQTEHIMIQLHYQIRKRSDYEMKKFIYKHILRPKTERAEMTANDNVIIACIGAITLIIITMIIGHYVAEIFKFERLSHITDTCRVKYIITDFEYDESNDYLCESHLFDGQYYNVNSNEIYTNLYLHRRLNINDNGTMNDGMYENPLQYTAQ